jgi:hypothetical protein
MTVVYFWSGKVTIVENLSIHYSHPRKVCNTLQSSQESMQYTTVIPGKHAQVLMIVHLCSHECTPESFSNRTYNETLCSCDSLRTKINNRNDDNKHPFWSNASAKGKLRAVVKLSKTLLNKSRLYWSWLDFWDCGEFIFYLGTLFKYEIGA